MMCPNCGYCRHCGRGGQHAQPWMQGPIWIAPYVSPNVGGNQFPSVWQFSRTNPQGAAAQPNVTVTVIPNAIGAH